MVKLCNDKYTGDNSTFIDFDFELDHFQKYAIDGFNQGKHVLITAHTGSGKTLPAEYIIEKCANMKKKVIYTSPIKSLSNQKYYEFSKKFPNISFGVMTGDIKFNPEADCVIMTTEILRNALYNEDISNEERKLLSFDIDFKNDVGCVIFDEVHYINDKDRGKIWEESIMKMPDNIQMLMLSATIDKEKQFAEWIEKIKHREVWIASTDKRVVPLNHFLYYITNSRFDKKVLSMNKSNTNTSLSTIKSYNKNITNKFLNFDDKYSELYSLDAFVNKNNIRPDKKDVIQKVVQTLKHNNMLPAICFIFSRKHVEEYAKYIEGCLFNDDEAEKPSIIERECKKILMKFPNYNEYTSLIEYSTIVDLMKKGVSIHHSGLLPVFREMIEIMFEKGFIKLLFATETFAVGINMPTKTVLFTSFSKYSNNGFRNILSHEYTQMAGRAGRRGLDTVGNVIHLNNLFQLPDIHTYKSILSGKPQVLKSKFVIEPQLVLKLLSSGTSKDYIKTSMNETQRIELMNGIDSMNEKYKRENDVIIDSFKKHCIDISILKQYIEKTEMLKNIKPKKKRALERELASIKMSCNSKTFDKDIDTYERMLLNQQYIDSNITQIGEISSENIREFDSMFDVLYTNEFINSDNTLSQKGHIASRLNELNNIVFSEIITKGHLDNMSLREFVTFISLFIHFRVSDEGGTFDKDLYKLSDEFMDCLDNTTKYMEKYSNILLKYNINFNEEDYSLCYTMYDLVLKWCDTTNEMESIQVINECNSRGVFIGEFVKCLLKIVNISNEIGSISKCIANVKLESLTSNVEEKILKFVATNQSLYV